MSCTKAGGPILMIYTSVIHFPRRMSLLGVLLIMLHINGVKSKKHCRGMIRHFQPKLADFRWMAVCRLQVDRFLQISGEMLSGGGSDRLGTHYLCTRVMLTGVQSIF